MRQPTPCHRSVAPEPHALARPGSSFEPRCSSRAPDAAVITDRPRGLWDRLRRAHFKGGVQDNEPYFGGLGFFEEVTNLLIAETLQVSHPDRNRSSDFYFSCLPSCSLFCHT